MKNETHLKEEINQTIAEFNALGLTLVLRFIRLSVALPDRVAKSAIAHMENTALLQGRKDLLKGIK